MKKVILAFICVLLVTHCQAAIITDAVISVTASEIGGSGDCPVRLYPDGSLVQEEDWGSNNTGLGNFFSNFPRPLFPSYVAVGFSWKMTGGSIDGVPVTITANIVSTSETVNTSSGDFSDCVKITYAYTYDYDPGTGHQFIQNITRYFKSGVGIVKLIVERPTQTETSALISYSISGGQGIVPLKLANEWTYEWDQYWWWTDGNIETFEITEVNEWDSTALFGKVVDAETVEPLGGIEVTYWNEKYDVWKNSFTNPDGSFLIAALVEGIAEINARPGVGTGFAWSLPWGSNWTYINEGEDLSRRFIALQKGASVTGYIKDSNGNPLDNVEYEWAGKMCEGRAHTDVNGHYEIRLPLGTYNINMDEDNLCALPRKVTITDINQPVDLNDIVAYSGLTGASISGEVNNPGAYSKTGQFLVVAFEAGTVIDANTWYPISPLRSMTLDSAGPFAANALPPDANYDVYLCVLYETAEGVESLAIRDILFGVPVGTNDVSLNYTSEGGTVMGGVANTDGQPVLGAVVLLVDSTPGNFSGFGYTDPNGEYVIYNVPAGTYNATVVHSKYLNTSTTVEVIDSATTDAGTIVMPFTGQKEAANLNGDGIVNMLDFAEFGNQWHQSGLLEADFNQDSTVDFMDLARFVENWLWQPIWYHD